MEGPHLVSGPLQRGGEWKSASKRLRKELYGKWERAWGPTETLWAQGAVMWERSGQQGGLVAMRLGKSGK